jgi:porin
MVNILYWRQDLFNERLSLYIGKIHPNEYISLSMFNNDERAQFLNGGSDGNLTFASDGTYAGGAAVEFQATQQLNVPDGSTFFTSGPHGYTDYPALSM